MAPRSRVGARDVEGMYKAMSPELLGVILGLLASLSFESSYLLMSQQSRIVRRSARPGGRFLVSLLRRPLWLLATAIDGAGIVLELFALREASLIVVQPLMSVGLIGLVFATGVFLGERIDRRTVLAAAALATGVVCVIVAAPSDASAVRLAHPVASTVVLGVLALVVISAYLGRGHGAPWRSVNAARRGRHARRHLRQLDRSDRLLDRRGAPVMLMVLLSSQRISLSPDAATLLALGLVLTGGGAYRLAATAGSGPLADI
jgi:hypothetical protein